ncbi:hypothetical protein V6N13_098227 [Hibiscus sabdariffa]|uniref:Uncharacterized protein n=1 Tax=Hibiscus sabdariffa TaxID=183260 RepID=A0ABR2ED48_9ROSI
MVTSHPLLGTVWSPLPSHFAEDERQKPCVNSDQIFGANHGWEAGLAGLSRACSGVVGVHLATSRWRGPTFFCHERPVLQAALMWKTGVGGVHLAISRWLDPAFCCLACMHACNYVKDRSYTMSSSPDCDTVGRWGKSLDFSDDEENIVPITEDDDVHLLDADDVEVVMAYASEENGLDVEDDV